MNFNKEQQRAVDTTDKNLLIAASAGTGKTTVLIGRTLSILKKKGANIAGLVLLSYNSAIAAEMVKKLRDELIAEAGAAKTARERDLLIDHIDNLPLAKIFTFHGFCKQILLEYPQISGVNGGFTQLDAAGAKLFFNKCISDVFTRLLSGETAFCASPEDYRILTGYFDRQGEKNTRKFVTILYEFSRKQLDPDGYFDGVLSEPTDKNGKAYKIYVDRFNRLSGRVQATAKRAADVSRAYFDATGENSYKSAQTYAEKVWEEAASAIRDVTTLNASKFPACRLDKLDGKVRFAIEELKLLRVAMKGDSELLTEFEASFFGGKADGVKSLELSDEKKQRKEILSALIAVTRAVGQAYREEKDKNAALDYDDLQELAVKTLQEKSVAEELRKSYAFMSVDEYQDANDVQEYVINALCGKDNLFTVGDVKQSIYKFRFTSPKIMCDRRDAYDAEQIIYLNENYRSDNKILDYVNRVFCPLMTRDFGGTDYAKEAQFGKKEDYQSGYAIPPVEATLFFNPPAEETKKPLVAKPCGENAVYSVQNDKGADGDDAEDGDRLAEALYIASKIKTLFGSDIYGYDKEKKAIAVTGQYKYNNIALLVMAKTGGAVRVIKTLSALGIPLDASALDGGGGGQVTAEIIQLLKVVYNVKSDIPLAGVMCGFFGGFSFDELLQIRRKHQNTRYFHEAVLSEAAGGGKCGAFIRRLEDYHRAAGFLSVAELMRHVDAESGYSLSIEGDGQKLAVFRKLTELLDGNKYGGSLAEFLYAADELDLVDGLEREIKVTADGAAGGGDAVNIATVHGAKGLEWNAVFVIDAAHTFNNGGEEVIFDKEAGIALKTYDRHGVKKDSMLLKFFRANERYGLREEKLRLFYVALTRAKNYLCITGTGADRSMNAARRDGLTAKLAEDCNSFFDYLTSAGLPPEIVFLDTLPPPIASTAGVAQKAKKPDYSALPPYPYEKSARLMLKNTATSINAEEEGGIRLSLPKINAETLTESEHAAASGADGTAYHKIFERIDYGLQTEAEVAAFIQDLAAKNILNVDIAQKIEVKKVLFALKHDIIKETAARKHAREKSFMLYLPAKEIIGGDCDIEDKILVQGTIDLIVFPEEGKRGYIVDFKLSKKGETELRATYQKQLDVYRLAAEKCLGGQYDAYIFAINGGKLISM